MTVLNQQFDLITIGDSTIDTFIRIHDATVECDINHEECKICVAYGSKIPVDAIAHGVAGNAANVAVGASRLGLATATYTNLGDDEQGKTIKKTLEEEKVAADYIVTNEGKESNLSVVLTFQGERTIFVYHQDWFYQLPKLAPTKWLYLTSMAETFTSSNIMDEVCHYVDENKPKLVYGPGTYQLKADLKRYSKVLERCEVLIVNKEEAKKILGVDQTETTEVKDLLSKLLLLGPKQVVITDGQEGSYATDGSENYKVGIFPTQLVEKTGAGDAYSAGLISGLNFDLALGEAMVWGAINASSAISVIGPQKGLMRREDLERHRKVATELSAVNF